MTTSEYAQGTAYLTVRENFTSWKRDDQLRPVKVTSKKPTVVDADCVVIKIRLQMPRAAFRPLEPSAVVTVPAELVQYPVEVEAQ